jgi:hypothetical protein
MRSVSPPRNATPRVPGPSAERDPTVPSPSAEQDYTGPEPVRRTRPHGSRARPQNRTPRVPSPSAERDPTGPEGVGRTGQHGPWVCRRDRTRRFLACRRGRRIGRDGDPIRAGSSDRGAVGCARPCTTHGLPNPTQAPSYACQPSSPGVPGLQFLTACIANRRPCIAYRRSAQFSRSGQAPRAIQQNSGRGRRVAPEGRRVARDLLNCVAGAGGSAELRRRCWRMLNCVVYVIAFLRRAQRPDGRHRRHIPFRSFDEHRDGAGATSGTSRSVPFTSSGAGWAPPRGGRRRAIHWASLQRGGGRSLAA